mgnify:CR=1 FL=1
MFGLVSLGNKKCARIFSRQFRNSTYNIFDKNYSFYNFPERTYRVRSDQMYNITWFNGELRAMRDQLHFYGELTRQHTRNVGFKHQYQQYKEIY